MIIMIKGRKCGEAITHGDDGFASLASRTLKWRMQGLGYTS
jgi:hypothetical protein